MSDNDFYYDVFLSHSSKDKSAVRILAEQLRLDGLQVWFDEWQLKQLKLDDTISQKVEEGLEHSRVLVLCMSANAFGSDWAHLESQTFRFRDPVNKDRRFIPLRLDNVPIKGSLAQSLYLDWVQDYSAYAKLLEACQPLSKPAPAKAGAREKTAEKIVQLDYDARIRAYAFNTDGTRIITGASDNTLRLWDLNTGRCLRVLQGHSAEVSSVERKSIRGRVWS
jgi:hypothetical protein